MTTNEVPSPDDQPENLGPLKRVRVVRCGPGRAKHPTTGDPVAMLTLRFLKDLQILMISLPDSRMLLVNLVTVLAHFDDPLATEILLRYFPEQVWPTTAAAPARRSTPRGPHRAKPSASNQASLKPIHETDAWRLHLMLKNVKSHDDFLKLIGVQEVAVEPVKFDRPTAPIPTIVQPVQAKKRKKTPQKYSQYTAKRKRKKK